MSEMSSTLVAVGCSGSNTAECHEVKDVAAVGSMSNDEGDRNNWICNRWPHQETSALLKIRSDMDVAFHECTLKSSLWEVVSRKLAELGYDRSAKKCKEKFENIYKYHKRTKGREAKHDGKTYRFSSELEALGCHPSLQIAAVTTETNPAYNLQATIPSSSVPNIITPSSLPNISAHKLISTFTSSFFPSGDENEGSAKKKRKLSEFFDNLMKEVIKKQEILQNKFLETLEKREIERIAREEAWRMHEVERIKRKQDILMQERMVAASREATVIELLKNFPQHLDLKQFMKKQLFTQTSADSPKWDKDDSTYPMSSSRWPKAEVEALIKLRTKLERRYQENAAKGPLWADISLGMKTLGYDRNAKRCKEKWENINKYFKKVKESNKMRPEGSKTCPYFHQLDALYKERMDKISGSLHPSYGLKVEDLVTHIMNQPEQPQMHPQHEQLELDGRNTDYQNTGHGHGKDENEDRGILLK